uniref:protein-tyrosine-phosphatase n=1 Tax=Lotharella globosa TaxID=91324 RepID=A0A7S3YXA1_9EUKA
MPEKDDDAVLAVPQLPLHAIFKWLYVSQHEAPACNRRLLERMNVGHIINMAAEIPNHFAEGADASSPRFDYLKSPDFDTEGSYVLDFFISAVMFIESVRKQGLRVLIHCAQGTSRSTSMAVCYVMYYKRLRLEQARAFIRNRCKGLKVSRMMVEVEAFQHYLEDKGHFNSSTCSSNIPRIIVTHQEDECKHSSPRSLLSGRSCGMEFRNRSSTPSRTSSQNNLSIKEFLENDNKINTLNRSQKSTSTGTGRTNSEGGQQLHGLNSLCRKVAMGTSEASPCALTCVIL